jgi:hypothetical protein
MLTRSPPGKLELHLLSLAEKHLKRHCGYYRQLPFTVLVAGEAAGTPEFMDVVHGVDQAIPKLHASEPKTAGWEEKVRCAALSL